MPSDKHPRPWNNVGSVIFDANGKQVAQANGSELAARAVQVVNARETTKPRREWDDSPIDLPRDPLWDDPPITSRPTPPDYWACIDCGHCDSSKRPLPDCPVSGGDCRMEYREAPPVAAADGGERAPGHLRRKRATAELERISRDSGLLPTTFLAGNPGDRNGGDADERSAARRADSSSTVDGRSGGHGVSPPSPDAGDGPPSVDRFVEHLQRGIPGIQNEHLSWLAGQIAYRDTQVDAAGRASRDGEVAGLETNREKWRKLYYQADAAEEAASKDRDEAIRRLVALESELAALMGREAELRTLLWRSRDMVRFVRHQGEREELARAIEASLGIEPDATAWELSGAIPPELRPGEKDDGTVDP